MFLKRVLFAVATRRVRQRFVVVDMAGEGPFGSVDQEGQSHPLGLPTPFVQADLSRDDLDRTEGRCHGHLAPKDPVVLASEDITRQLQLVHAIEAPPGSRRESSSDLKVSHDAEASV